MIQLNTTEIALIALIFLIALCASFALGRILRSRHASHLRQDAITRSKSVILWEVYEKILPFLPNFPFAARDMVFVGKWVDYVVFDGLSTGSLKKIVFLELKSGGSSLNKNERMIREVVESWKIEYKIERLEGF